MSNYIPPLRPVDIPRLSTFLDPSLNRSALQGRTAGDVDDPDPINTVDWFDPLDPAMLNAIARARVIATYTAIYKEPITTVSAKVYGGTTTGWHAIVYFNGFVHPDDITPGTVLRIPDLTPLRELTKSRISNGATKGQVRAF